MSETLVRTPVYQQLNHILRTLVGTPEFPLGSRFLTEREIAGRFIVSRATANKAISNLVSEGVLEFRKGMGTFVRGHRLDTDLRALVSFTAQAQAMGKVPTTQVLDFRLQRAEEAGAEVAEALGLAAEEPLVAMSRLRLADAQPLILEWRWMASALVPNLTREEVGGSLYLLLQERFQLTIGGCEQAISAVNLDRDEAHHLMTAVGAAGLQIRSTGYLADRRPLWHERTLYRGDGYTFINRLGHVARHGGGAAQSSSVISSS